jgi:hypothetical protein
MMAASAISGICNLAPLNLSNQRASEIQLSRMLKHGRTSEVMHQVSSKDHGICSCGMENGVSTSGQSVLFAGSPHRKLQKKLSMKKAGKKSSTRAFSTGEKWGMDVDGITENTRRQKRRAALAALAVAGYVSIMQPSLAAEIDFPAPPTTVEALEAQFKGSTRMELEREIQIQRKEWEMTNVATTTAPSPTQSQQSLNIKVEDTNIAFIKNAREMFTPILLFKKNSKLARYRG